MPGRDGTGPMGEGFERKVCTGTSNAEYRRGLGLGRGLWCRRGFGNKQKQTPLWKIGQNKLENLDK